MEGRDEGNARIAAKHVPYALPHFPRRLVSERNSEDLVGGDALAYQVIDACGEHACLPAAGAGKDRYRPLLREHRALLRFIQSFEIFHVRTIP